MKQLRLLGLLVLCPCFSLFAQTETESPPQAMAERSWLDGGAQSTFTATPPLSYAPVREADILWEKRVWRVIDTREKLNLPFRHPQQSLYTAIAAGMESGELTPYSPEDDRFKQPQTWQDVMDKYNSRDSIGIIDPVTGEYSLQVVVNTFDPDRITRWRVQEIWYFDTRYSTMRVRILSLAPILETYGEDGTTVRYETPMFWVNYAQARAWLAQFPAPIAGGRQVISWEDVLEMRRFRGYIYQDGDDMHNRRLKDYLSGTDLLLRSGEIDQSIQHYEMDLWEH